ncbi:hypothetical protein [Micromonospora sp. NPDC005305]|uniref:hypothetical protein n=1 Tax=Micromonospora sp. NPDC005305 TaxID=3156875 RepID=UPI0033B66D15
MHGVVADGKFVHLPETSPYLDHRHADIGSDDLHCYAPPDGAGYMPQDVLPGIMVAMNADWVTIVAYENVPGCLQPLAAARA